jgi:hypothetical protein
MNKWLFVLVPLFLVVSSCAQTPSSPQVSVQSAPSSANAGDIFTIPWRVSGDSGTASKAVIYYGPQSVANPTPTAYTTSSTDLCSTACAVPATFQTPISITEPGTYYYRVYVLMNGQGYWSPEGSISIIQATPTPTESGSVTITDAPDQGSANTPFTVSYTLSIPGTTTDTGIVYGPQSVANPQTPRDYSSTQTAQCTSNPCTSFSADVTYPSSGIVFYRAYAIINGQTYFSDENVINIS